MSDRDRRDDDGSAPPAAPPRMPPTVAFGPPTGPRVETPPPAEPEPAPEPGAPERSPGPEPPTVAVGSMVADRYKILRFVARGGMAEVYEAEDVELEERMALKFLTNPFAEDIGSADRFRREVQL